MYNGQYLHLAVTLWDKQRNKTSFYSVNHYSTTQKSELIEFCVVNWAYRILNAQTTYATLLHCALHTWRPASQATIACSVWWSTEETSYCTLFFLVSLFLRNCSPSLMTPEVNKRTRQFPEITNKFRRWLPSS